MSTKKPKHVGVSRRRLNGNPEEKRFANAWEKHNAQGHTLDWILAIDQSRGRPHETPERERVVAATVVQWLGSPVGCGFLSDLGYAREDRK